METDIATECAKCGHVVAVVEASRRRNEDDGISSTRIALCSCPNCDSPILVSQTGTFDDWDGDVTRLYPPADRADSTLPENVRAALDEAKGCARHGYHTAAVVMARRVLEVACKVLDPTVAKGTLEQRIAGLAESKRITAQLAQWADALRVDGNLAAHDPDVVFDQQHARDVILFAESFTTYTFVLDLRFNEFMKRRQESKARADAANNPNVS